MKNVLKLDMRNIIFLCCPAYLRKNLPCKLQWSLNVM